MKHLKYFNEGISDDASFIGNEIKSIFKTDYDKLVKNLFNRIKETFNIDNLSYGDTDSGYGLIYNLEETDSEYGFIKLSVVDTEFFAIPGYDLCIDGEEIKCSFLLKRSIYRFLNNKWKSKDKEIKKADILRLQKKYDV